MTLCSGKRKETNSRVLRIFTLILPILLPDPGWRKLEVSRQRGERVKEKSLRPEALFCHLRVLPEAGKTASCHLPVYPTEWLS